ncbi:MAG: rhomboid family intramembrane serine protease [Alistipes sp.]|nr:rhomboid family intramembrane serine protease [Rikenellaceae bacterium]MBR1961343.1 rhomboid family intramembrane serine protease [Alistipes sp.]
MNPYFKTPPVVQNLIIANCVIYLAMALIPAINGLFSEYLQLFWVGAPYFHSYQFVSYMFLHGGFGHLFSNMFALWMFGRTLEYELGSKRFLIYYMVCGIGAALFQMLVAWLTGDIYFRVVGASGAVMGLLLAFGVMHPNNMIYIIPLPFPIKAKWFVLGYAVLEIALGWSGAQTGVAHFAHVGGMLWGLILLYWWRKNRKIFF